MNSTASRSRAFNVSSRVEHLRLDRDVERRHRFVGHQHLRVERQRARNSDPLALSAGKFMRKASRGAGVETHQRQQFFGARESLRLRDAVRDRAVGNNPPDPPTRIERGEGILEHHLDVLAGGAQAGPTGLGEIQFADAAPRRYRRR